MWAARSGHLATVRLLVRSGADVRRETMDGETAETLAMAEDHERVSQLLCRWWDWVNPHQVSQ